MYLATEKDWAIVFAILKKRLFRAVGALDTTLVFVRNSIHANPIVLVAVARAHGSSSLGLGHFITLTQTYQIMADPRCCPLYVEASMKKNMINILFVSMRHGLH